MSMCSEENMKEPWKKDTNDRYTEFMKSVVNLALASLLLPVFFSRTFFNVPTDVPLVDIFDCSIYLAWIFSSLSILSGLFFQYCSAKWLRKAWGKEAGLFFCKNNKEKTLENIMDLCHWICVLSFMLGVGLTIFFFATFEPSAFNART